MHMSRCYWMMTHVFTSITVYHMKSLQLLEFFQRTMETLLQGIPFVAVFLDNILITGHTEEEHLKNFDETPERLSASGLCLKEKKCHFMKPTLDCLGHHINSEGFQKCTFTPERL